MLEEKIRQNELLNNIISNSPYGVVVYDAIRNKEGKLLDFKYKIWNDKSEEYTHFDILEKEKTLKEISAIRGDITFYEKAKEVLENGKPKEFEYYSKFLRRWFLMNVTKFNDGVLVNSLDITQRKINEEIIEEQNNELQSILDASLNAVFACEGVRDENDVIYDLVITKVNKVFKQVNTLNADALGKRLSVLYPEVKKVGLLNSYCNVIQTGESFRTEIELKENGVKGWYDIAAVKKGNNGLVITFINITNQKNAIAEINKRKELLDNILKHSPVGISISEVIRDKDDKIIDFRAILSNEAAARHSGMSLTTLLSKTSVEIDPNILNSPLFQLSIKTLKTGKSFHTQYYFGLTNRWLELSVAKMDNDHLICVFDDITSTKIAHLELVNSTEKLNTIINISQSGFFVCSPVLNSKGDIIDFKFTLANEGFAQFVQKKPDEVIGESGKNLFIEYKKNGLFDKFKEAFITDTKIQFDYLQKGKNPIRINITITKLGNELLGTITECANVKN